ncbi:MAG: FTR1 family iron permease [Acidimicrobiales bacterium]
MVATLVIFLRESLEASIIVAILLAYLDRAGQRRHFKDVFVGVAAGVGLATVGGVVAYVSLRTWAGSRVQTIFETVTYLLAAAVLTYMTFWMRSHSRTMSADLRRRADAALSRGARGGLTLLAFQAVGREGLETVVFTLAIVFATSASGALGGAAIGSAAGLGVAFVIYKLGHRLNMGRFFKVVGALLMVFAAGLLVDAVENLQELGWVRFLTDRAWNTGTTLRQSSNLGDLAHVFFGYADRPTVLQLAVYAVYIVVAVGLFLHLERRQRPALSAESVSQGRPPAAGTTNGCPGHKAPAAPPASARR